MRKISDAEFAQMMREIPKEFHDDIDPTVQIIFNVLNGKPDVVQIITAALVISRVMHQNRDNIDPLFIANLAIATIEKTYNKADLIFQTHVIQ